MAKLRFGLELVTTKQDFKRLILKEMEVVLNTAALITSVQIKPYALTKFTNSIKSSKEVLSLYGGDLQAELGAPNKNVSEVILNIIDEIIKTYNINVIYSNALTGNSKLKLVITMSVFPYSSINNLVNGPGAVYITKKGVNINWLDWLLLRGDVPIINSYTVTNSNIINSRTGLATMKKSKNSSWRVPPQFSGVEKDNFITRALDDVAVDVTDKLIEIFKSHVK